MKKLIIENPDQDLLIEKIDRIYNCICKLMQTGANDHASFNNNGKIVLKTEHIYLETHEVCQILLICPRTLSRLRDKKKVTYVRKGTRIIYRFSEIERIVEERLICCKVKSVSNLHMNYIDYLTNTNK